jgi:hypothetical protein
MTFGSARRCCPDPPFPALVSSRERPDSLSEQT